MKIISLSLVVLVSVQLQEILAVFIPRTREREAPEPMIPAGDGPKAHWFNQKLDHFDQSNNKTWKQRYYYNDDYYKVQRPAYDQLPMFLMIGGEAGIQGGWVNGGFWWEVGRDYRALFIYVEHRFYGKSQPTDDMSDENLKYLSSKQALADLDYFIDGMKKKFKMTDKNKVVVFGGSYSGALAAWVRLKYPEQVFIAHASSAPVEAIVDFTGYNKVSYQSLAAWDPQCASTVQSVAEKQAEWMQTDEGLEKLSQTFGTCLKLTTSEPLNVQSFFQFQVAVIGNIIQYNGTGDAQNIPDICNAVADANVTMMLSKVCRIGTSSQRPNQSISHLHRESSTTVPATPKTFPTFATQWLTRPMTMMLSQSLPNRYLKSTAKSKYQATCTGSRYTANVASEKNVTFNEKEGSRQWLWQTCSEFGFFMSADDEDNLFAKTLPLSYYLTECKDVFGDTFTPEYIQQQVDATNEYYGGKDYKESQTLFTQGSIDQWHDRGITESNDQQGYEAVYIDNASHCQDQNGKSDSDPPGLTEGRKKMREILQGWITSLNFQQYIEQQQQQQNQ
ncbi:hypothetical protein LSTR_LSTR012382 [Laodelphax striatellus]|uniref:Serine protease K12H4.7 n=1 Tax=Laodelphax striatellus TaxID=195883 RepID=A0A482WNN6_LAOST|nr:hypothetical protein LSTR_LSTR012382 [Laodelphax striatellus]